jgi:phosphoribosyl 1,2-cyclic phosphate phosphodiesterase
MNITILGSGTSQGVPIIGCSCSTCQSSNEKNKRLRASAFIETKGVKILIDTSIDFRQQILRAGITDIDAVLFTHHHVDHIFGMDDLRQINQRLNKFIDIFGNETTMNEISITFRYAFDEELIKYKCVPLININRIKNEPFTFKGIEIIPIEVFHGRIKIFGYRIGKFAYITDCSYIPESEYYKFENLDALVLNSLRRAPHPTHFNLEQAVEKAELFKAKETFFTHITHDLEHEQVNSELPDNIKLSYDGLKINIKD